MFNKFNNYNGRVCEINNIQLNIISNLEDIKN